MYGLGVCMEIVLGLICKGLGFRFSSRSRGQGKGQVGFINALRGHSEAVGLFVAFYVPAVVVSKFRFWISGGSVNISCRCTVFTTEGPFHA